jgi:hypothetical protein
VSSDDDPFFLHTLEVSEEDFQGLKADQGILVDFGNFPGKIISLLERCLASQSSDMPRFQVRTCEHVQQLLRLQRRLRQWQQWCWKQDEECLE